MGVLMLIILFTLRTDTKKLLRGVRECIAATLAFCNKCLVCPFVQ